MTTEVSHCQYNDCPDIDRWAYIGKVYSLISWFTDPFFNISFSINAIDKSCNTFDFICFPEKPQGLALKHWFGAEFEFSQIASPFLLSCSCNNGKDSNTFVGTVCHSVSYWYCSHLDNSFKMTSGSCPSQQLSHQLQIFFVVYHCFSPFWNNNGISMEFLVWEQFLGYSQDCSSLVKRIIFFGQDKCWPRSQPIYTLGILCWFQQQYFNNKWMTTYPLAKITSRNWIP